MWRTLVGLVRGLLRSRAARDAVAEVVAPAVLGVAVTPPRVEAPAEGRELRFRGERWQELGAAGGVVTFGRDVAVEGRVVRSEVRVLEADLEPIGGRGWTLKGRS